MLRPRRVSACRAPRPRHNVRSRNCSWRHEWLPPQKKWVTLPQRMVKCCFVEPSDGVLPGAFVLFCQWRRSPVAVGAVARLCPVAQRCWCSGSPFRKVISVSRFAGCPRTECSRFQLHHSDCLQRWTCRGPQAAAPLTQSPPPARARQPQHEVPQPACAPQPPVIPAPAGASSCPR